MEVVVISANTSWYLYNFRQNTILALVECGYKVYVVAPVDDYTERIRALGCSHVDIRIDQAGTNPIKDILTCAEFFRIYKQIRPRVVLNFTPKNNIYSTFSASLLSIPCINNIAGLGTVFVEKSITSWIVKLLYKGTQGKAKKVFFQNDEDLKLFVDSKIVLEGKTHRLFGSGIDLQRFTVSKQDYGGVTRFLLVARLLKQKGIYEYAAAAKQLKIKFGNTVQFRLIGFLDEDNPNSVLKNDLTHWVKSGYIEYLGTSDQIEKEISNVDCMVLPSMYREGVPKSLLEGLGSGKAIITTDNVGCRDTVFDGVNGYLCDIGSVPSLLQAMESFINLSHEDKRKMGAASRKLAENVFDENVGIKAYLSAISEVT